MTPAGTAARAPQVISAAASRHSLIATKSGEVWSMGHNDSKGGGGHGSPGMTHTGQLGRGGSQAPGKVEGLEVRSGEGLARPGSPGAGEQRGLGSAPPPGAAHPGGGRTAPPPAHARAAAPHTTSQTSPGPPLH